MKRLRTAVSAAVIFFCALAPAAAPAEEFRTFRDENFGFSFQLPSGWNFKVTESKDYLFSGPSGGAAAEATIVVQIVQKSANPGSSSVDQLKGLWGQLSTVPAAELVSEGMVPMAGGEFPFFIASYRVRTRAGQEAPFGHLQAVVDHGDYYFPLSYSAPQPAYEEYLRVFKHLAATFAFE